MGRLVIDGEQVYELDEECLKEKREEQKKKKENSPNEERGRKR